MHPIDNHMQSFCKVVIRAEIKISEFSQKRAFCKFQCFQSLTATGAELHLVTFLGGGIVHLVWNSLFCFSSWTIWSLKLPRTWNLEGGHKTAWNYLFEKKFTGKFLERSVTFLFWVLSIQEIEIGHSKIFAERKLEKGKNFSDGRLFLKI